MDSSVGNLYLQIKHGNCSAFAFIADPGVCRLPHCEPNSGWPQSPSRRCLPIKHGSCTAFAFIADPGVCRLPHCEPDSGWPQLPSRRSDALRCAMPKWPENFRPGMDACKLGWNPEKPEEDRVAAVKGVADLGDDAGYLNGGDKLARFRFEVQ